MNEPSPCLSCGACCATYRVSFYWAESLGPLEPWTERLTPHLVCMVGTSRSGPRCAALQGVVGDSAFCSVYAHRPSPCRELEPGDERCDRARIRHGLSPLTKPIHLELPGLATFPPGLPSVLAELPQGAVAAPSGLPTAAEPGNAGASGLPDASVVH